MQPQSLKPSCLCPPRAHPGCFLHWDVFCGVQWKVGGNTDVGMGHQDFKTECGRHCCDEGLCWHCCAHRPQRVTAPSPAGRHRCPHSHTSGKTQNSTPGMLLGCSEAVAAVLFLSAGPHSGSSPSCRQDSQGFHGYPCWISQGFQHFGHADPSCLPLNPSFMAERGPLAVHTLRALVAAAPERGSRGPALPASSTLVWGFNKGFQGGEAFD